MQYALVISNSKVALAPCHPARARKLLRRGDAAVHRLYPFTIRLKHEPVDPVSTEIEIKIDPGSKVTGIALVQHSKSGSTVVYGINLHHRGQVIKAKLYSRRNIRRSRRNRKTRYRKPRFSNRTTATGWLAPSIMHRVLTVQTWIYRLMRYSHVVKGSVELVKFDMHKLKNPGIVGKDYQQGPLFNTQMREYLLSKFNHTCVYCGGASKDKYLVWEHVVPRSKGGSDSSTNAVLACSCCNRLKGNQSLREWLSKLDKPLYPALKDHRIVLKKRLPGIIKKLPKGNLRDAAVVNAIRYRLGDYLGALVPFQYHVSWLTKVNRKRLGYVKDHWIDAAVLGTDTVDLSPKLKPVHIYCTGHGDRQMTRVNKFGFPRTGAKTLLPAFGYRTGDLVRLDHPKHGCWVGKVAIRLTGSFVLTTKDPATGLTKKVNSNYRYFTKLHSRDGYTYTTPPKIQFIIKEELLGSITSKLGVEVDTTPIQLGVVLATIID